MSKVDIRAASRPLAHCGRPCCALLIPVQGVLLGRFRALGCRDAGCPLPAPAEPSQPHSTACLDLAVTAERGN